MQLVEINTKKQGSADQTDMSAAESNKQANFYHHELNIAPSRNQWTHMKLSYRQPEP